MTISDIYKKHPGRIFQEYKRALEAQKAENQHTQKIETVRQSHMLSQVHLLNVVDALRQWYEQSKSDQAISTFVQQWIPQLLNDHKTMLVARTVQLPSKKMSGDGSIEDKKKVCDNPLEQHSSTSEFTRGVQAQGSYCR